MTSHFDDSGFTTQARRLARYLPDGPRTEFHRLLEDLEDDRRRIVRERTDLAVRQRAVTEERNRIRERLRRLGLRCDRLEGIFRANAQAFDTFRSALTLSRGLRELSELPRVLDALARTMGVSRLTCLLCREDGALPPAPDILLPDRRSLVANLAALPGASWDHPLYLGPIAALARPEFFFGPQPGDAALPRLAGGSCCIGPLADKYRPDRPIGALAMADPDPERYAPDKGTDFLEHFLEAFAGDLQHVRTHEELLRQRELDELTGIANRAFLNRHGPPLLALAERKGTPLTMLFCDLDRFKAINDGLGHAMGDAVLAAVARAMAGRVRAYDLLARLGGDEFVVLLPDTDSGQAMAMAARLRQAVTDAGVEAGLAGPDGLSVSIGLAAHVPGQTIDALIRRADAAMYSDKRASG